MGGGITLIISALMMLFSSYSHAQYTCDEPIQAECDNQNGLDWHLSDQGNTPLWFNFNACNKDLEFSFYMYSNLNDSSAYLGIDSISVYENNGDCENPTLIQTFYSFQFLMNLDQGVDYLIKIYLIEDIDEEYNFSILIRSLIESNCISNCMTNNLIINGDFEYTTSVPYDLILLGGNPHTSLDYTGTSFGNGYGKFTISGLIGAHPFTYNLNYGTTFDHTTGSGNFMYIDSPNNNDPITVWQQDNIPVVQGKEYLFSVWVKQLIGCFFQGCNNFPRINIYINNQEIISLYEIKHINWEEICYNWTANTTGNISIKITTQQNTISGMGYDFGIDDIVFGEKILNFDIVAPAKVCEYEDFNISVSNLCGTPPYTYLWNTNETTSQITTHINTSTTFSVTVTDANAQSTTSSILVEPLICCESTYQDYTWTEETISTTSEYTFDNQTIHINGDVILDGKFTFSNCTIELAPNASLILGNEDKVFTGNTITYCRDYVWKEIKMLACNNSFVDFNENIIEYSINGIVNETSRKTDIIGNQFINNYEQSIYISDWQSSSSDLNIKSNIIKHMINDYVNPYIGYRPKIGILLMNNNLNGSHLNIGFGNTFKELYNGIYSISSDAIIFNNLFENIGFNSITDPTVKSAIYAQGLSTYEPNEIIIGGDSQNSNTFDDCLNGIYITHNYNCLISYNTFSDKTNGVAIKLAHLNGYNLESALTLPNLAIVERNNINNYTYGIHAGTNAYANIEIKNNPINCPTSELNISRGVIINGLKIKNEKYIITNNTINNATYGIYANNTFEASIRGNNIQSLKQHYITSISSRGIHVLGSYRAEIIDNKVVGLSLPTDAHRTIGVHIENSNKTDVFCNELRTLGSCFRGTQNSISSRIYKNKFYNSRNGLTLANSGNIGEQGSLSNPSDNEWEPSVASWISSGHEPHYTYGSNGSVCTLFVKQGQKTGISGTGTETDFINQASAFTVNNNATGNNSILCTGQGGTIHEDPIDLNMAKALIDENLYQPTYEEESYEIAKSEFLLIFPEDSLAMTDIDIQNFITDMSSEPKGILAEVHRLIEQKEYVAARNLNNSFQALTSIEETEQTARSIQLNLLENDSISNNEIIILEQLAELCPFTHGQGVYIARALYSLIDPLYEFVNICETDPSFAPKKKQITDKKQQILIYPNPASEILNFELKNIDLEGNAIVQISDVNGRIVFNKTTEIRLINTLDVSNLTNGCYSLKIILSSGQTFNEKICLTK